MRLEDTFSGTITGRKSAASNKSDELGYTKNIIKIDSMMKNEWLNTNLREAKMQDKNGGKSKKRGKKGKGKLS